MKPLTQIVIGSDVTVLAATAAHGGRVDVYSNTDAFGHGTAIGLTLPAR